MMDKQVEDESELWGQQGFQGRPQIRDHMETTESEHAGKEDQVTWLDLWTHWFHIFFLNNEP